MATQGLVTIIKDKKVFIKVVSGCNGFNAKNLAESIKTLKLQTIEEIYDQALKDKFGCTACLVVYDKNHAIKMDDEKLSGLYTKTFNKPKFNPRWDCGTADCIEIINI